MNIPTENDINEIKKNTENMIDFIKEILEELRKPKFCSCSCSCNCGNGGVTYPVYTTPPNFYPNYYPVIPPATWMN